MKEKYHYFKPRVEVETEEEGNKSHIKEIYIRGDLFLGIIKFLIKRYKSVKGQFFTQIPSFDFALCVKDLNKDQMQSSI